MEDARALLDMTPNEIKARFDACAARRRQAAQDADLLGWLVGRYVLIALHAPRRYPRRPDALVRRARRMSGAEMKRVFAAMAAERGMDDGSGGDA